MDSLVSPVRVISVVGMDRVQHVPSRRGTDPRAYRATTGATRVPFLAYDVYSDHKFLVSIITIMIRKLEPAGSVRCPLGLRLPCVVPLVVPCAALQGGEATTSERLLHLRLSRPFHKVIPDVTHIERLTSQCGVCPSRGLRNAHIRALQVLGKDDPWFA